MPKNGCGRGARLDGCRVPETLLKVWAVVAGFWSSSIYFENDLYKKVGSSPLITLVNGTIFPI